MPHVYAAGDLVGFPMLASDVLANIRELERRGVRFVVKTQGIDVRPGGDAMSRLILTTLAGVAEFERDLIRERTRLGLVARAGAGRRIGRPRTAGRPTRAAVERARRRGLSWGETARALRCPPPTLRRIAGR